MGFDSQLASNSQSAGNPRVLIQFKRMLGLPCDVSISAGRVIGPDRFSLLDDSPLTDEHLLLSKLFEDIVAKHSGSNVNLLGSDLGREVAVRSESDGGKLISAAAERAASAFLAPPRAGLDIGAWLFHRSILSVIRSLLSPIPPLGRDSLLDLLVFIVMGFDSFAERSNGWFQDLAKAIEAQNGSTPFNAAERRVVELLGSISVREVPFGILPPFAARLMNVLQTRPCVLLIPGEFWTDALNHLVQNGSDTFRQQWTVLLSHAAQATNARPSAKWIKVAKGLVGHDELRCLSADLVSILKQVDRGRSIQVLDMGLPVGSELNEIIHAQNAVCLRGLLWMTPLVAEPELIRAIGDTAMSCYRKIKGVGPRATKVANAAVYALSEIASQEAVGQLAMLKARVKFAPALKEIEKAFNATAAALNVPVDEVEEMAVPAYGLTEVGRCTETFGDYTAELTVTGTSSTEIAWLKADGKRQQSVPAVVKEKFAEELKELQAAAKDIQRMLPAQRERIDSLFLQQKCWPFAVWRERYLDHPLVGVLARRLLWVFTNGKKSTTGIWFNGNLVDIDLKPVKDLGAETTVTLWHPIGRDLDEIVGWRAWLDAQQIQQPFKQAHREVYVLTDAERRTNTYSNRFAAHLLKQHQFNALAALRGWKNKLRLMVDAEFPPATRLLPQWGLRAEFWIEGAGDGYGTDTNETGTFLRVATDQVRFYPLDAAQRTAHAGGGGYHAGYRQADGQPLPLEEVPALVFSEIMRDVDLFVGVASVGNDQTWADGGPQGRYRDYWQSYSFGELAATAQTRKEVLQRLVPRLKIAGQCSFADKFLVVKGSLRTYKIHLGSGNILMEPNDQYLCIVPDRGSAAAKAGEKVFLPFEGDSTLSIILSKAFLLAEDQKIKDETILRQLEGK